MLCASCPRSCWSNNRTITNLLRSEPPTEVSVVVLGAQVTSTSALKRTAASTDQERHCLDQSCGAALPAWRPVPRPDAYVETLKRLVARTGHFIEGVLAGPNEVVLV